MKPAHLRSVAEINDKGRHLEAVLEIPFPKEEDRYRIPANCVHAVDYILSADPATLAKQRQSQVKRFEKLAQRCLGWDERMKKHVQSPDTVRVLN